MTLRGGRLMGVEEGDIYLIMAAEQPEADRTHALAEATVERVAGVSCRVRLRPLNGHGRPPDGSLGFLIHKNVRRGTVRVDGDEPLMEQLRQRIEGLTYLRLYTEAEPAMATVTYDADGLTILDSDRSPWLVPTSLEKVMENLQIMARADALRRLESGEGPAALLEPPVVTWGRIRGAEVERLGHTGETILEGRDKVYVEVTNPKSDSARTIYVSILDIGLTGRVALVTDSRSFGIQVSPGESTGVGVDPYDGPIGVDIRWADGAPRARPRRESLVIITTDKPHDLRALQGRGAARGDATRSARPLEAMKDWFSRGTTREMVSSVGPEYLRYFVSHIDFVVVANDP